MHLSCYMRNFIYSGQRRNHMMADTVGVNSNDSASALVSIPMILHQ
nr:hypothetical protein [Tanacetum cinerariifolium]